MRSQWRVILGFILVILIVLFAVLNNESVPVNFGFNHFTAPLILIILGSAVLGALIGLLASTTTLWRQKKVVKELQKQLSAEPTVEQQTAEQQLAEVKATYEQKLTTLQTAYDELKASQTNQTIDRFVKPRDIDSTN